MNKLPCSIAERIALISYTNPAEFGRNVGSVVFGNSSNSKFCVGVFRLVGAQNGYGICKCSAHK